MLLGNAWKPTDNHHRAFHDGSHIHCLSGKKDMSYYFIVTISLTVDAHTPYDAYVREIKAHC